MTLSIRDSNNNSMIGRVGSTSVSSSDGLVRTTRSGAARSFYQDGMTCSTQNVKLSLDNDNFMSVAYARQAIELYPGAVYTFEDFFGGNLKPVTVPRNQVTLRTSMNTRADPSVQVRIPDGVGGTTALTNAVHGLRTLDLAPGVKPTDGKNFVGTIYRTENNSSTMLALTGGGSFLGIASGNFAYQNNQDSDHRYFLVDVTKEMFTIEASFDADRNGGLFTADAKVPPHAMLMNSVTYGGRAIILIDTKITSREQGIRLDAGYNDLIFSASSTLNSLVANMSSETTVRLFTVGGTHLTLFNNVNTRNIVSAVNTYLANLTTTNAEPIKYSFADMQGNQLSTHSASDEFPTRNCLPEAPTFSTGAVGGTHKDSNGRVLDSDFEDLCGTNEYLVGFRARTGAWVDGIGMICAPRGNNANHEVGWEGGGNSGSSALKLQKVTCPNNQPITAIGLVHIRDDENRGNPLGYVNTVAMTCFGENPSAMPMPRCIESGEGCGRMSDRPYNVLRCRTDEAAMGIQGRVANNYVDALGLVCRTLHD
ncbi:MAG: hypothetical protein LBF16_09080 [Pseudomonadales bacterium]|nr:hypothetical protein [Pseudomonadales bacterium]